MALSILILGSMFITNCGSSESADTAESDHQTADATSAGGSALTVTSSATDIEGTRHQMSTWVGQQPVVINFWGTWCPPCRREIPELVRLYDEYKPKGVEIVSLAIRDTPAKVRMYSEQAGMDWVMLIAEEDVAEEFGLGSAVPTTIFYDKDGNERARFIGARGYEDFKEAFEKIVPAG